MTTFTNKYKIGKFVVGKQDEFLDIKSNEINISTSFDNMTQTATISIPYQKGKSMGYKALERRFYYDINKYVEINQQLVIYLYYDELFDPYDNDDSKKDPKRDHSKRITYYGYLSKVSVTETNFILELEDDMFLLKQKRLKISKTGTTLREIINDIQVGSLPTNTPLTKIFDVVEINKTYNFKFNKFDQLEPWTGAELLKMLVQMFDGTMYCFFRSGVLHFGIKYYAFIDGYKDLDKNLRLGYRRHTVMTPNKSANQDIRNDKYGLYCDGIDFIFSTFDRKNTKINVISSIGGKSKYVSVFSGTKGEMNIDPDPSLLKEDDEKFLSKNIKKDDINLNYNLPNLDLFGMKAMAQNIWNNQVGGNLNKNMGSVSVFGNRFVKIGDIIDFKIEIADSPAQKEPESYFVDGVDYICNENGIRQKITLGSNLISFGNQVDDIVKNNIDQYE